MHDQDREAYLAALRKLSPEDQLAVRRFVVDLRDEAQHAAERRYFASRGQAPGGCSCPDVTELPATWSAQDIARWLSGAELAQGEQGRIGRTTGSMPS